jgi:hypothetical protein
MLTKTDANGQTASDSFGFQYASRGVLTKDKYYKKYQMGGASDKGIIGEVTRGASSIPGMAAISSVTSAALNSTVCGIIGGPVGTTIACAGAIAAAIASFGLGTGVAAVACLGQQVIISKLIGIALPILLSKVVKTAATDNIVGGDVGNAATGGASAMASLNGRYHGEIPLTKSQVKKYDTFSNNAQGSGNWEDTRSAFDIHNPNSFASKLATAFLPSAMRLSASPANAPSVLAELPSIGLSQLISTSHAKSVIDGEYDQCDDPDYEAVDVATDPFCVPQYGLNPSMSLGDTNYNKPVAALDAPSHSEGFNLASLFTMPTAKAAGSDTRGFTPDNRFDADLVINYMHDGAKPWIDDDGEAIAYDDSDDDYADYTEQCLETIDPIGPDSPDMCKPKKCVESSAASDTFRYCMYSQYAEDSGIDDQLEDRDADLSGGSTGDSTNSITDGQVPGSLPTGSAEELAKKIVDSGKVSGDSRYYKQITDIAKRQPGCYVSPSILGFVLAMSEKYTLHISSLNRRCTGVLTASGEGSLHYAGAGGRAVDIDMVDGVGMGNSQSTAAYDSAQAKATAEKYFKYAVKILPKNAELGQINSCGLNVDTSGFSDVVTDTCNHAHVGIP